MKVHTTAAIREMLLQAAGNASLPENIKSLAKEGADEPAIEWNALKSIVAAVNAQQGNGTLYLHQLCQGGGIALPPPPPPRPGKSPELQAHLEKLRLKLEQDTYDSMVADITVDERRAAEVSSGGLVTYRQQLSFGLHVIVMMGAFYIFGHLAGMAVTSNRVYHPIIGLAFMISAMLVETVLFVIRTTVPPRLHWAVEEQARQRQQWGSPPPITAAELSSDSGIEQPPGPNKKDD